MEKRDFPFVALILVFPIAQILLCWVYINIQSILLAFTDGAGNLSTESIERLINALVQRKDNNGYDIIGLLGKSSFIWIVTNAVGYSIGMVTTYMLARHMIGHKIFRVIYHVPGLVGGVVMSTIWKEFFAGGGAMVTILTNMGFEFPRQVIKNGLLGHESTAFATLMIKDLIMGLSGGGLILTGAFMRIPTEVFESAELDGCGFFRETFQIAIPCAWPTISTMLIFGLTGIFSADLGFYLYSDGTGKFGMQSIGFYMYKLRVTISEVTDATYLYGYVSAFGMFLTVITLPLVLFSRWLFGKMQDDVGF